MVRTSPLTSQSDFGARFNLFFFHNREVLPIVIVFVGAENMFNLVRLETQYWRLLLTHDGFVYLLTGGCCWQNFCHALR